MYILGNDCHNRISGNSFIHLWASLSYPLVLSFFSFFLIPSSVLMSPCTLYLSICLPLPPSLISSLPAFFLLLAIAFPLLQLTGRHIGHYYIFFTELKKSVIFLITKNFFLLYKYSLQSFSLMTTLSPLFHQEYYLQFIVKSR